MGIQWGQMESGASTEGTSAAAQLAECCSIPLAEAASFLEATDGSIPAAADLYFASVAQQGPEHRSDQEEPTPKRARLSSGAEAPVRTSDLAAGGSAFLQQVPAAASLPEQVPAAAAPRTILSDLMRTADLCLRRLQLPARVRGIILQTGSKDEALAETRPWEPVLVHMQRLIRSDEDIHRAANAWCCDLKTAKTKYGPISEWIMCGVTNTSKLFRGKRDFNSDISRWNVANVTDTSFMFDEASSFISRWTAGI